MSTASEAFYIVLENRCQMLTRLYIKAHTDHVAKYKMYVVESNSSKTIGLFELQPYHIWVNLHGHWHQLHLKPHHRYIGADWMSVFGVTLQPKTYIDWHWWNPFPSFTLLFCPEWIELQKSRLFYGMDRVIFLGDSLSDKGTLHKYTFGRVPKSPPYYNGVFSNGRPWTVRLAEALHPHRIYAENYAVGGATVRWRLWPTLPYSLNFQIDAYLLNHTEMHDHGRHVVFILLGANDYLMGKYTRSQVDEITTETIATIQTEVDRLLRSGVRRFVIIGLPDLGLTPKAKKSGVSQDMNSISLAHNRKLHTMVERYRLQYTQLDYHFHYIDVFTMLHELLKKHSRINKQYRLAISNFSDPCWKRGYTDYSVRSPKDKQVEVLTSEICLHPDHYLFWDEMHPTQIIHDLLYRYILNQLDIKIQKSTDKIEVC